MSRKIHALGVAAILGAAAYGINRQCSNTDLENRASTSDKHEETSFKIVGPVYDDSIVPANNCSRYVRLAAKDMFGIEYPADDAWNLRNYGERVVSEKVSDLRKMIRENKLRYGDILAVYNPASKYNGNPNAKKAGYTHVMLYLGTEGQGEPIFADKFGSKTRGHLTITEIEKSNLKPVEVLHYKKK